VAELLSPLQLELPLVLDRYPLKGAGPGGSSYRLGQWLEHWKNARGIRVLIAADHSELVVVSASLELEPAHGGYWRLPR